MIIGLGSSPDQTRQINQLLTGQSFDEAQVHAAPSAGMEPLAAVGMRRRAIPRRIVPSRTQAVTCR